MNISSQTVEGKCDNKCEYSFSYTDSSSTAKNNGIYISLSYDDSAKVSYNQAQYTVGTIQILNGSLHRYEGLPADGEIQIIHYPILGGNELRVCIPLSKTSGSPNQLINDVILKVAANAPAEGDETNLNIPNFNLQSVVPFKPYFAYTSDSTDYLVYGILDAIMLPTSTVDKLNDILKPYPSTVAEEHLYFNSTGPSASFGTDLGNDIYISCQPTGTSEETVAVSYSKNESSSSKSFWESQSFSIVLTIVLGGLFFVLMYFGLAKFYDWIEGTQGPTTLNPFHNLRVNSATGDDESWFQ